MTIEVILNWPFALAAAASLFTAAVHVFLGGPGVAKPLLEAEMPSVAKFTNYYCWHIVSITLIAMAVGFAVAATQDGAALTGLSWTLIAAAFAIWSLALAVWKRMSLFALPQWLLFAPIAALGVWGLA